MKHLRPVPSLALAAAIGWAIPAQAQQAEQPAASSGDSWSIKPRGRLQLDLGAADASNAVTAAVDAINQGDFDLDGEVRRAYLGVDGKIPGGLGFRVEADFAGDDVTWTDVYLTYDVSDQLRLTLGHQKPFWGLEEMTSDLHTSFTERAAINTAFGYERRVGISAAYNSGAVLVQGGVFRDDMDMMWDGTPNGYSVDGRVVVMPELGSGQLHLGGSVHFRELDDGSSARYRARPFIHTVDTRFVDTGSITEVERETGYGLELAYVSGPFHAAAETHWQQLSRASGLAEPTFFGGYVETGYFLTAGDSRGYKGGTFDRIRPTNPLGGGGIGAIQINLRYEYLDLIDAGFIGGKQNVYTAGLVWVPTANTKLMLNYGRVEYDQAVIAAAGERSFGLDTVAMRVQFDF